MSHIKNLQPGRPRLFEDEEVIDAAVAVFSENGFAGTSAQDLCDSTGLGRGSLYNAFGSKQAIYEQALTRSHQQTMSAQLTILNQKTTTKERLRTLLLWGVKEDLEHPDLHEAMVLFSALERGSKDEVVAKLNREYRESLEQSLVKVFTEGQQKGELNKATSPINMARGFLAGYYGLRVLRRNISDMAILESAVEGILINL